MTRRTRFGIALLTALVVALMAYTPYYTVQQMRKAARNRDAERLSSYIDFPAVRDSLKAGVSAKLGAPGSEAQDEDKRDPLEGLGAAVAMTVLSPMIDALVTTETVALMLEGEMPMIVRGGAHSTGPESNAERHVELDMGYASLNTFVVTAHKPGEKGEPFALVLQRDRLVLWKLTAIRLPL